MKEAKLMMLAGLCDEGIKTLPESMLDAFKETYEKSSPEDKERLLESCVSSLEDLKAIVLEELTALQTDGQIIH